MINVYNYASSSGENRQIQFFRGDNEKIEAWVFDLNTTPPNLLSIILSDKIDVEMKSTISKVEAVAIGRILNPNRKFSSFSEKIQNALIQILGSWRQITVEQDAKGIPETLRIYNPT